jgi:ParB family chromosome partitioning protein
MSRRSKIGDLIAAQLAAANSDEAEARPAPAHVAAGPVRTMGLTLDKLELERKSLEAALAEGGAVVELDPADVAGSFAADRFGGDDAALEELKRSIAGSGQEVPILVRPAAGQPGRYQAAYGHRRLAACRALGRKVRALVRPLTDAELVVAQGLENAARVDLSFIEKASFALDLETRGFERATIMAALSTDKTELSKLISTARAVPGDLARAIGPAPRAGRRRWMALAGLLASRPALKRVETLAGTAEFRALSSDARFIQVFEAASRLPAQRAESAPFRGSVTTRGGEPLAEIEETGERLNLRIDRRRHVGFADWLVRMLPDFHARYLEAEGQTPEDKS